MSPKVSPPTVQPARYYGIQLHRQTIARRVRILKAVLFVGVVLIVLLIIRDHYDDMIQAMGTWGWLAAICHNYPLLSYAFFKNKNTPDAMVNYYYACINNKFQPAVPQSPWACSPPTGGGCVAYVMNPANPRGVDVHTAMCTVMGVMENNADYGYNDIFKVPDPKDGSPGGFVSAPPTDSVKEAVSFIYTYVLPLVMLGAMFF